jgi:hypothetical protein
MWMCIAILLLLRLCWQEWKTYRKYRSVDVLDPSVAPFNLSDIMRKSGIKRPVQLAVSEKFDVPSVYGIRQPKVVFPLHFLTTFSSKEIQWVVLHELSHIKRCDQLVFYFQTVVRVLFFFHPLVYVLDSKLYQCRECMSDDFGLEKTGINRTDCGDCFVRIAEWIQQQKKASVSVQEIANQKIGLAWRLNRIFDEERKLQVKWEWKSNVCLTLAVITVFTAGIHAVNIERKWNEIRGEGPAARHDYAMAYDQHNQRMLLFGGDKSTTPETWQWDGIHWDKVSTTGPSPRTGARMVYDQKRQQMLLFGGRSSDDSDYYNDTWVWNEQKQTWTGLDVKGPEARSGHALAYDAARETVVLFGGKQGPFQQFDDTWEWDGKQWTKAVQPGPSPRYGHAMAYDPVHQTVLLMGGENKTILGDTWEWDGSTRTWTLLSEQGKGTLKQRTANAMAYDPRLRRMALYGGHDGLHSFNETWIWDNTQHTWIKLLEGLEGNARAYSSMAYDESRRVLIRFGGVDLFESGREQAGTWVY